MSDVMKWLYPNYIKPYLDAAPRDDYELWLSLMEGDLPPGTRPEYEKCLEFTAVHAFLLGLRTGGGLTALTPR